MDQLQYQQYSSVVASKQLSLDGLKRIIKHDKVSGWTATGGGLARIAVLHDCINGIIPYKENDDVGDKLYGIGWPLPLSFSNVN